MKFLFRTDASFEIGAGHFMRCFALSQRLKEDNNDIIFLTNTQNPDLLARIDKENIKLEKSIVYEELLLDAKNTVKVAQKYNTDWIITDGYKFETNYQRQIKKSGFKLMCIDDVAACHYVSDIILNQNLNANRVFKYSCEKYTKLLLGLKFVLLRREYRNMKNYNKVIHDKCNNLLITIGGNNMQEYIKKLLDSIYLLNMNLNIKILAGSKSEFKYDLNEFKNHKHSIELIAVVDNIIPFIKWCDLAITASGSTVWELMSLQTPMITIVLAKNQEEIANQIAMEKAGINLSYIKDTDKNVIAEKIESIIISSEIRKNMAKNCKRLIPSIENNCDYFLQ